jgi:hypothetical protein
MFAADSPEEADAIGLALAGAPSRRLLIYGRAEAASVRASEIHFLPEGTLKTRVVLRERLAGCVYVLTHDRIAAYPLRWRNQLACCGLQPLPHPLASRERRHP